MKEFCSLGLRHEGNRLRILDQTLLPHEERWIEVCSPEEMRGHILRLAVRGAPLIGVAAAVSLAKFVESGATREEFILEADLMGAVRPTAVNLSYAVERMKENYSRAAHTAEEIFAEDVLLCERMAEHGSSLIEDGDNILTHCNTGGLATVGIGTALGVIRKAHELGKKIHVFVDETRPLLQGSRLTAWELSALGISYTLISDNMAGALMAQKKINKIFVGADRITIRGDVANKIGTYSVAVLANFHKIPFFVVAPETTRDSKMQFGADIPIEERNPEEVRFGKSPYDAPVWNPAFDVTPRELITGIVLNTGVV